MRVGIRRIPLLLAFGMAASSGVVLPAGGASATVSGPCGAMAASSTHYRHVIWVWMENHSYPTIVGNKQAPYENRLAKQCGLATNYHNISHPSLPNYVGATSGLSVKQVQKFSSDCSPSAACSTSVPSIFSQAPSWRAYEDSMPGRCHRSDSGEYAVRHNPPPYFTTLRGCSRFDVPYTRLRADLADKDLPAFAFITPNLIHDMHDGTISQGDTWLSQNLPAIFASPEYRSGTVVVFVTWDEGEGGTSDDCPTNTTDVGCHIPTIVASPSTRRGTRSHVLFNHYSLLHTAEALLGLPLLGQATHARSMVQAFDL